MWLLLPLLLLVVPGCVSSISGPRSVSGSERDSVTIWCHYDPGYESYKKWWCHGEAWSSCKILLETSGSEQRVQGDRVAIKDDHSARAFAVTVEKLRRRDEGFYWCGIERSGTDLGHQVRVLVGPAKPVTTYPAAPETMYPTAPETTYPAAPEMTYPAAPETTYPAAPETTYPAAPETTPALASLAPSPPVTQIGNSSVALTGSLISAGETAARSGKPGPSP
ncbi:CMRF35-like molecule 7 isoform 2-T2 [Molossus nigricans]